MWIKTSGAAFALVAAPLSANSRADDAASQAAIAHLLTFVQRSSCTFIRNGDERGADEAARHMKRKYDYFRDRIRSPEDLIALAGTRSELTGKPYRVRCGHNPPIPAADWLQRELAA